MLPQFNTLKVLDYNFLPSFEMLMINDSWQGKKHDIYDEGSTINYEKLGRYFKINLKQQNKKDGKSSYLKTGFKNCEISDFTNNGYQIKSEEDTKRFTDRLCPMTNINKNLTIKNEYNNYKER